MSKDRNRYIDALRGLAILMVVLGHTMTGVTKDSQESLIYNIIWSLQMPLFMLISGYIIKYGKKIYTKIDLSRYLKKRTIAYLLPWIVWSILIRGVICGKKNFLSIRWIFWHMDSGYWFLFTLWTISVLFGISEFVSLKILKSEESIIKEIFLACLLMVVGGGVLVGIGTFLGFTFLGIKLTIYYIPFYLLGYIWGRIQEKDLFRISITGTKELVIASSFVIYTILITHFNVYLDLNGIIGSGIRMIISITGCIAICGLLKNILMNSRLRFDWIGEHSLEIYLAHYLFLNRIVLNPLPRYDTVSGILLIIFNFAIVVMLSYVVIQILNSNKYIKFICLGKK